VLWAAIKATQERWPRAKCVVYTGDHDANKAQILGQVKTRFNIDLYAPTITFLYLTSRHLVLAATWPRFTLAGQSLGSLVVAWDALQILVPDIFIDTMGYAFSLGLVKALFGASLPTAAYVHYPTISTDMIASLDPRSAVGAQGVNAGQGVGLRGVFKAVYWRLFATAYSAVGATIDVVMTNSSWTQAHVVALWGRRRKASGKPHAEIEVVFPPCAVAETERDVEVSEASEARREKLLLVIAQFRPEKNHRLVVEAFAAFLKQAPADATRGATLALVGSVRNDHDSKRVYQLRLLVNELGIRDRVEFHLDAPWLEVVGLLRRASVGVNGMWNEHFGIGVVEYQAAGLISVVHDSGGPKLDIVVEVDGGATGFHATTVDGFAAAFEKALTLPDPLAVRRRARVSARRFTEEEFARKWLVQMERLVALAGGAAGQ
jgi:alpha-1,2-mannosyltransferase